MAGSGHRPLHPRNEDRGRDRARETRARSRVRRRAQHGMVQREATTGSEGCWKMFASGADRGGRRAVAAEGTRGGEPTCAAASAATQADAEPGTPGAVNPPVEEPLTEELLDELLAAPSPVAFTEAHGIAHRTLAEYLNQLLAEKGLKRAQVVREAGLNETFGYQIFKGQRGAGRDKVLCLSLAMGCDLVETRRLLKAAGVNELYCKDRRDAIIIFCIDRGFTLQQVDDELYRFGEKTLGE